MFQAPARDVDRACASGPTDSQVYMDPLYTTHIVVGSPGNRVSGLAFLWQKGGARAIGRGDSSRKGGVALSCVALQLQPPRSKAQLLCCLPSRLFLR